MDLVIKNGTVVTAAGMSQADVAIRDGRIIAIGENLSGDEVVDAGGCYVMPGGIDVHTHVEQASFNTTSIDTFETATRAAACGGTTSIVDFCQQDIGGSLDAAIRQWDAMAEGKAAIDYGYHIIIRDLTDAVYDELGTLPERGICSFKVFMAYRGMNMVDDVALIRALDQARKTGALVLVHAENGDATDYLRDKFIAEGKTAPIWHGKSRPPRTEAEATARALALAEIVDAPIYIVHLSCEEALEELVRAKTRGVAAHAETCTQYLYLTLDDLDQDGFEGAKYVFTPPPRSVKDQEILWKALEDRVLETVASDHCSWSYANHKTLGQDDFRLIPNGLPGIEERMMMVWQGVEKGRISPVRFVEMMSTRPAQIFGMFPQKGTIAVGSDADLVIWDPAVHRTIRQAEMHNAMDYSAYEGHEVKGAPRTVLLRGKVIVRDGAYVGAAGDGRFLKRKPYRQAQA